MAAAGPWRRVFPRATTTGGAWFHASPVNSAKQGWQQICSFSSSSCRRWPPRDLQTQKHTNAAQRHKNINVSVLFESDLPLLSSPTVVFNGDLEKKQQTQHKQATSRFVFFCLQVAGRGGGEEAGATGLQSQSVLSSQILGLFSTASFLFSKSQACSLFSSVGWSVGRRWRGRGERELAAEERV